MLPTITPLLSKTRYGFISKYELITAASYSDGSWIDDVGFCGDDDDDDDDDDSGKA